MIVPAAQVSSKTFDYVVVGGGTTGLTLATRLSEDSSVSVLVIEAGEANLDDPAILMPAAFGSHFGNPKYDWGFQTLPQQTCNGRSIMFNRGKGLGGSSAINFFQYHRPAKSDIDAIGGLGNPGWNWDLLERYYSKTEQFVEPKVKSELTSGDPAHHGFTGPLTTAYAATMSNFETHFQTALKNLGIDTAEAPFSGNNKGFWITPLTVDPGIRGRSYAANKYYQPNASRENLLVVVSCHVTKIVTKKDSEGRATATGVTFVNDGTPYTVGIEREVILSAGAIMSPQILELSGIGDKEVLDKAGVETLINLPGVGTNVQEHIFDGVSYELREDISSEYLNFDTLRNPQELPKQVQLYRETGTGVFGMGLSALAFVPLASISSSHGSLETSIIESIKERTSSNTISASLQKQYRAQLEHIKDREPSCEFILATSFMAGLNTPKPGTKCLSISTLMNHPFSRGTIHIASNDALKPPSIDPHYFEEDYDLRAFVEQIKFARKVFAQDSLKSLLIGEVNPGPQVQTDEQIAEYIKSTFSTTWHTTGSCSMLPLADGGVVDNKLKVYHTTNIRVVDISILPLQIGAHLQSTAYALGELAADIIKGKVGVLDG
ncbi:alcohol oxidase [Mycena rebaudengoi]|nr:alcohol oxidase [Mycena rebaudengoi]